MTEFNKKKYTATKINSDIKYFESMGFLETDDISDGQHTFRELYYHRMILFSLFVNSHKEISWKSWLHNDGTMFDGYFIVGVTTPEGDYSYHYKAMYWDMFNVTSLTKAPVYDGHKPSDINRLLSVED